MPRDFKERAFQMDVQNREKFRVLFISQYFWPEHFRANDIVLGLKERGCEVTVVTGLPNYPQGSFFEGYGLMKGPYAERWNDIRIIRIPMFARGRSSKVKLAFNYLSFAVLGSVLIPFRLVRSDYDIILCWMVSPITQVLPAIVAKKLTQRPLVLWVMDLWPDSLSASGQVNNRWVIDLAGRLTRWVYRRCDKILGQSQRFAQHIARIGGFASHQIDYMPQWETVQPPSTTTAVPELPAAFNILFAGNIGFSQDFETVIAAADILRDKSRIQWHIVGDGHALPFVRKEIKRLNLGSCIHIWGRYPPSTMNAFYDAADVLLATLRAEEVFTRTIPTKVQAYLASGKPMVTAIDGEVADLIRKSGAGIAARAGDPVSLAQAIHAMANMTPDQRTEMGAKGRSYYAEYFDREILLSRLVGFLRDAVRSSATHNGK